MFIDTELAEEVIKKYDLNDEEFDKEWDTLKDKKAIRDLLIRAERNTRRQIESFGRWEEVDYIFEQFDKSRKDPFGLDEYGTDGKFGFVETLPSRLTPWRATARRLQLKFKVDSKQATKMAYMLFYIAEGSKETAIWFEAYANREGFDAAYRYAAALFYELRKLEPQKDRPDFIDGAEEASVEDLIDRSYKEALEALEGATYRALPVGELMEDPEPEPEPESEVDKILNLTIEKIRRAGKDKLPKMGKKLYEWSRRQEIKEKFGAERIEKVWRAYKARKDKLIKEGYLNP